jgi:hypothetical protein
VDKFRGQAHGRDCVFVCYTIAYEKENSTKEEECKKLSNKAN